MIALEGEVFGGDKVMRRGLIPLIEEALEGSFVLLPGEVTVKSQLSMNQELGRPDTKSACMLILYLQASRTMRNKFRLCISYPVYGIL